MDCPDLRGLRRALEMERSDGDHTQVTSRPSIAATILAAALGTRMGNSPKYTLHIGGVRVLERMVSALQDLGMTQIHVVVGPYQEQVRPLITRSRAGAYANRT